MEQDACISLKSVFSANEERKIFSSKNQLQRKRIQVYCYLVCVDMRQTKLLDGSAKKTPFCLLVYTIKLSCYSAYKSLGSVADKTFSIDVRVRDSKYAMQVSGKISTDYMNSNVL